MSALVVEDAGGRRLLTLTLVRALAAASVVVPGLAAVVVVLAVAHGAPWWPAPVLAGLVVVAAVVPDSGSPALFLAGLGSWWLAVVREPPVAATVAVAGCGLLLHVACARAASGPPGCVPSAGVVGRLAVRTVGVLAATAVLAVAVTPVDDVTGTPPVLVAAALLVVAALPWLATRGPG